MKRTLLVPFGLKNDYLFECTQVPNGKACGCICPACKKPLVAKQNASTPHFAHAQDENCSTALETAVHLAVKQIIAEKRKIRLPSVIWDNPFSINEQNKEIYIEQTIQLDSVELEYWLDNFRPDIVVIADNTTYLVEVAVTHFIDKAKLEKIVSRKIPTFEIDVSDLKNRFTLAELETTLFTSKNYQAEWKYHPRLEQLDLLAEKDWQRKIALYGSDGFIEEQEDKANEISEEEIQQKFRSYRNLGHEQKFQVNLKSLNFTEQEINELSKFVAWDNSFGVPRIVWQSAVLAYIAKVMEQQSRGKYLLCSVNSSACSNWLARVFEINPPFKDGEKIAVWKYFQKLEEWGILKRVQRNDFNILLDKQKWPASVTLYNQKS